MLIKISSHNYNVVDITLSVFSPSLAFQIVSKKNIYMDRLRFVFSPVINYVAMNHRTLAMIIVVLPLSFIASVVISIRDAILSYFGSSHETKVKRVQREVKGRLQIPEHQRKFMCTARAPW